ncbi:integrase arm-type DNA-binding domain-containing protein [Azotobacter chroococcum]|uniref:Integrase arm-type DNA-binding domain-containing protein n=1 Tax=Azotobacter chroococcum TaxID=353 RepID=A0AA43Z2U2_9GAMM|nr:integrase arm-type DNA-binding domain-containing protein [Azotobacter chroococcum]NHN75883.1 integrase arm-type DNA-binding domain-containing protein [Azotobacter chroococcum]
MGKLTVKTIEKLAKGMTPGMTGDGDGLYFQISKTGGTSWIYRYRISGKTRHMGLGKYPETSLAKARSDAAEARKLAVAGKDPLAVRDAEREAQREAQRLQEAKKTLFRALAIDYQSAHGSTWSDKWRRGWMRKLELYAFPHIGDLPPSEIGTAHVLEVLQPIWGTKTRTADEVRGQLEQILDAAKARGLREGENPARWRGHLDNLLSRAEKRKARKRQHFLAMKWQDVPALIATLRANETLVSAATQLLILTGTRTHMVRFARWDEFDLETRVWALPPERMKMRVGFDVPLADEVIHLLRKIPRLDGSPYLFPGHGRTGVMHANAIRNLLHSLGHDDVTRHGFRSSFRDWAGECTHYPREICELALAHDERDQTEGAYSRSDFFHKRRKLMAGWARYATRLSAEPIAPRQPRPQ